MDQRPDCLNIEASFSKYVNIFQSESFLIKLLPSLYIFFVIGNIYMYVLEFQIVIIAWLMIDTGPRTLDSWYFGNRLAKGCGWKYINLHTLRVIQIYFRTLFFITYRVLQKERKKLTDFLYENAIQIFFQHK